MDSTLGKCLDDGAAARRKLERRPSKVDDAKALIVQKVGDRYKTLHEAFRKMDGAPRAQSGAILPRNSAPSSDEPSIHPVTSPLPPSPLQSTRTRS